MIIPSKKEKSSKTMRHRERFLKHVHACAKSMSIFFPFFLFIYLKTRLVVKKIIVWRFLFLRSKRDL